MLTFLRHAQSLANAAWVEGTAAQETFDVPLSAMGELAARELKPLVENLKPDLIVSSPLSRALRTAELCRPVPCPIYLHAALQEHVMTLADVALTETEILCKYPDIHSVCGETIGLKEWTRFHYVQGESLESLDRRIDIFSTWLQQYLGCRLLVVGHRAYGHRWLGRDLGNCEYVEIATAQLPR
jgi:broad specificity phosphatase PhoE